MVTSPSSTRLIPINCTSDDFDISGFICKPDILKSSRSHMITFVNDRIVKNQDLNRAINDGYYLITFDAYGLIIEATGTIHKDTVIDRTEIWRTSA